MHEVDQSAPGRLAPQLVRVSVYVMLFASAGAAFLLGDRLWAAARGGTLPVWVALVPVSAFTAFVAVYTVDRWLLVKRRNYPLGRAFFQVALAILFAILLWPHQASEIQEARRGAGAADPVLRLLDSREADVRAAMCELLALRRQVTALPHIERRAAVDGTAAVRAACGAAAIKLKGEPGGGDGTGVSDAERPADAP
ncbi:MAG: hypothetical protein HY903_11805 [Deltaproteobacteria bacterium]|nr:hypothetical protein [Deltaproteobacteria bacterium]